LKVVHIITRLSLGGAQENTLITCRLLARRGHDVTLIAGPARGPEGELFSRARKDSYKLITVKNLIRAIHPVKDILAYRQIKKHLQQINPDIVHTHSAKAGIIGRFAANSLVHRSADIRKPAIVHTIHGLAFHRYQPEWINKLYILVEKLAGRRTDLFISVADAMTEKATNAGIGEEAQFCTAYSAIDEDGFLREPDPQQIEQFRKKYDIPSDAVVLITVARLFKLKGHRFILQSAAELAKKYPNLYWLFVGGGKLSGHFKKRVEKLGLTDRVSFTGLLPPEEIPLAIKASDILVHCSLREGLARALPQAMLCGKPAISFDIDGAKEVVNEHTGRLIRPTDVEELIEACSELIDNPQLRSELGHSARESVKEKFAPDTMVDTIEQGYNRLLPKE